MVKLSARQTTGSDRLPRTPRRKWNKVFNTIAHYHRRIIARRLDSAEKWLNNFYRGFASDHATTDHTTTAKRHFEKRDLFTTVWWFTESTGIQIKCVRHTRVSMNTLGTRR